MRALARRCAPAVVAAVAAAVVVAAPAAPVTADETVEEGILSAAAAPATQPAYVAPDDIANPGEDELDAAARAASFSITYASDVPTAARTAVGRAALNWSRYISSPRSITLSVDWVPDEGKGYLATGTSAAVNLDNAGTMYPEPLANAIKNVDHNPNTPDMSMWIRNRSDFYYGTDGAVPADKVDLLSVVMHEMGHGLGFVGYASYNAQNSTGSISSPPARYDRFTETGSSTPLLSYASPSTALGSALTSDSVFFDGPRTRSAGGGLRAKLFAPSPYTASSYSHLDEDTYYPLTRNSLMTPALASGEAVHEPGRVALGMLYDMGWKPVSGFYGTRATEFADVNGDGAADAIAVTDAGVTVRGSDGNSFGPNLRWTQDPFYGTRTTAFADMNADGKADAVAVNDTNIGVRLSNGVAFGTNSHWSSVTPWYGSRGTYFADVNGDGKADAIAVNDGNIGVRISSGSTLGTSSLWSTNGFYGTRATAFADVTGDGKADAIAVNDGGVTVRRSTGTSFASNQTWTSSGYYGTRGTYFADVDDDGDADAIVVNDDKVTVRRASFNATTLVGSFSSNEFWTSGAYYGASGAAKGQRFSDVTGDGRADAVVINNDGLVVRRSSGTDFDPNEFWTG